MSDARIGLGRSDVYIYICVTSTAYIFNSCKAADERKSGYFSSRAFAIAFIYTHAHAHTHTEN